MIDLSPARHLLEQRITAPIVSVMVSTGITPNALTVTGFLISVVAGAVIAGEYLILGAGLMLFAGVFDMLDGSLARAKGQTTKFGGILDSTLDRLAEAAILMGLLILYLDKGSTWEPVLIYLTFVSSVSVSYVRARAEGVGLRCEVGIFTRAERVIVLAIGIFITHWVDEFMIVTLSILAALASVTVLQRLIHVQQEAKRESHKE